MVRLDVFIVKIWNTVLKKHFNPCRW